MEASNSFGPSFGLGVLVPVTLLLFVPLGIAVWKASNRAAKFVIVALWLRYAAGAYHLYMFKPAIAGLSGNAILSILVTLIGLVVIVRPANLAIRWLLPVYLIMLLAAISGIANGDASGAINAIVKYAYFIVITLAVFQALRVDASERFVAWLMIAFLPLLVLQWLSVLLGLPKGSEAGDGLVWIGGYNHEGAFSVALCAAFIVGCCARAAPAWIRVLFLVAVLIGIQLAGYRTAILALMPLAATTFWIALTSIVRRDQRAFMAASAAIFAIVGISVMAVQSSERFMDLAIFLADPSALIKPPADFTIADRQIMSARPLIWSSYLYAWADGSAMQLLFGFGSESWSDAFKVYPHNTLVSTLYELGLAGVAAMLMLWATMIGVALRAHGERAKLVAAHFSFLLLNMATMPFWQVEGLGLYGFLCGYTFYKARQAAAARSLAWRPALPQQLSGAR